MVNKMCVVCVHVGRRSVVCCQSTDVASWLPSSSSQSLLIFSSSSPKPPLIPPHPPLILSSSSPHPLLIFPSSSPLPLCILSSSHVLCNSAWEHVLGPHNRTLQHRSKHTNPPLARCVRSTDDACLGMRHFVCVGESTKNVSFAFRPSASGWNMMNVNVQQH